MYNVHIQKHPFKTDVEQFEIESGKSLSEAYIATSPVLPIEHARITVNDEVITDYTYIPQDNDLVCIKVVPGTAEEAEVGRGWSWAAFGVGVALFLVAGLTGGAGLLIMSGWALTVTGLIGVGITSAILEAQFDSEEGRQDIHGSSGGTSRWVPIPLVYGEHYLAPSLASSDYTTLATEDDLNNVVLHQLYVLGDQNTDWGTKTIVDSINIGDNRLFASKEMQLRGYVLEVNPTTARIHFYSTLTPEYTNFTSYLSDISIGQYISIEGHARPQNNRAFKVVSYTTDSITVTTDGIIAHDMVDGVLQLHTLTLKYLYNAGIYRGVHIDIVEDGNFEGTAYPRIVFESYIGQELRNDAGFPTYYTTPDNVKSATVTITCPQGLYAMSGNSKSTTSVTVAVKAQRVGTATWSAAQYIPIKDQNTNKARRKSLHITFETPGQWLLSFQKTTADFDSSEGVNTVQLDRVTCVKTKRVVNFGELPSAPDDPEDGWVYKDTTLDNIYIYDGATSSWKIYLDDEYDVQPVHDDIKTSFSYLAMEIIATDQLNGAINNLNCILRHELHAYDSVTETWVPAYSNNPAAVFVDILLNPVRNRFPIVNNVDWNNLSNVPIDWAKIEEWYEYCEQEGFSCNGVLSDSSTVKDELEKVAITGRASFTMKDGKYSVIIDQPQATPVQLFTPRNSHSFSANRVFLDCPDGVRVKFTNKDAGYQPDEIRIDFSDSTFNVYDEMQLTYITDARQAQAYAKYYLNAQTARQESFTFSTDFEYLVCTAGDRIKFQHDVPLLGMLATRVVATQESGGEILGLVVDESVDMEYGKTYAIDIRVQGTLGFELMTLGVVNGATEANPLYTTNSLTLTTPQPLATFVRGDLLAFGESGYVTEDLVITDIQAGDDLSAIITCTKYDETIYDLTQFVEWSSNIGRPASNPRRAYIEDKTSRSIDNLYIAINENAGNKVFNETQPSTPYRIGDIWKVGVNMYVATISRTADEEFESSDWQLATSDTFQSVSSETFSINHPEHRWYVTPASDYPMLEVHGFAVASEVGTNIKENVLDDDESYWESLANMGVLTVPEPIGANDYRLKYVKAKVESGQTSYVAGRWGDNAWHGQAFTNLIVSPDAPSTQDVVITAGDYVLQTYAGTVTCSYGSATKGNPLSFTSTGETLNIVMTNARYVSLTETDFIPPYAVGTFTGNYNSYAITVPTVSGIAVIYNRPSTYANIVQLYVDANNYITLGIIEDTLRVIKRGAGVSEYHDYSIDDYAPLGELSFTIAYNHDTQTIEVKFGNEATQAITTWAFGYTSGDDEIVFGYQSGDNDIIFGQGAHMEDTPTTLYVGCLHDLSSYANNEIHMIEM